MSNVGETLENWIERTIKMGEGKRGPCPHTVSFGKYLVAFPNCGGANCSWEYNKFCRVCGTNLKPDSPLNPALTDQGEGL